MLHKLEQQQENNNKKISHWMDLKERIIQSNWQMKSRCSFLPLEGCTVVQYTKDRNCICYSLAMTLVMCHQVMNHHFQNMSALIQSKNYSSSWERNLISWRSFCWLCVGYCRSGRAYHKSMPPWQVLWHAHHSTPWVLPIHVALEPVYAYDMSALVKGLQLFNQ